MFLISIKKIEWNLKGKNEKKFTRVVCVWGKPSKSSCCNWFICFSTDDRTWDIGDSLRCWSLLLKSVVPCNKDSTDVNGGGGGGGCLELFVRDDDGGSIRFDEINVGLDRTRRK